MATLNYKKRSLTSGTHLLGSICIIAGLFVLVSPLLFDKENPVEKILGVGIGAITIGLAIVSSYGGTQFNFTEKSYKEYSSICGFKIGEWTKLPEVTTVKLITKNYISINTPNGISPTFSGKVTDYKLLIFSHSTIPEFSFVYTKKNKAVKHAKTLADHLGAELEIDMIEGE
jgi:hypothetical protein